MNGSYYCYEVSYEYYTNNAMTHCYQCYEQHYDPLIYQNQLLNHLVTTTTHPLPYYDLLTKSNICLLNKKRLTMSIPY